MVDFNKRFCIVKLWPEIQAAEDECIARIKLSAERLGHKCDIVLADGSLLENPKKFVDRKTHDFVIHLHFDAPNAIDLPSFVALWNPPDFLHEWGYDRCIRNLMSHDYFLSCGSKPAEDAVAMLCSARAVTAFESQPFYHSPGATLYKAAEKERKLFYIGINWEVLSGKSGRYSDVLKKLDGTGKLSIFGPKKFQGINVWANYKSYVDEIPFDGTSVIKHIAEAGCALVFSSESHKRAGLMSTRLFEAIAAGAVVFCDENHFAKTHFGDCLIYINTDRSADKVAEEILDNLNWVNNNKTLAAKLVRKSQLILNKKFSTDVCLENIINEFESKHLEIKSSKVNNKVIPLVTVFFIAKQFSEIEYRNFISNAEKQSQGEVEYIFVGNSGFSKKEQATAKALNKKSVVNVKYINFENKNKDTNTTGMFNFGHISSDLIQSCKSEYILFSGQGESWCSDHISYLLKYFEKEPAADIVVSPIVLFGNNRAPTLFDIVSFDGPGGEFPIYTGRFLFKRPAFDQKLASTLPYLHYLAFCPLIADKKLIHAVQSTFRAHSSNFYFDNYKSCYFELQKERSVIEHTYPDGLNYRFGPFHTSYKYSSKKLFDNRISRQISNHTAVINKISIEWILFQFRLLRKHGFFNRVRALVKKLMR